MKKSDVRQQNIYLNEAQQQFLKAPQKVKKILAGRGWGKTTVIAVEKYHDLCHMARAKSFLASTTYAQLLTKTLPEMIDMWSRYGLKEDLHYVVGKKPPKDFMKPYKPPKRFENVITFGNGYTIDLLSTDRADLVRGGSYDSGDIDEDLLVKEDALNKVINQTLRGNRDRFRHTHRHHQLRLYGSVPWKPSGYYILNFEQKAIDNPQMFYWQEGTSHDNIAVLGEDYIERQRQMLPWLIFQVEILNKRFVQLPDGFYHKFDPEKHTRNKTYNYGLGNRGVELQGDKDVDPNKPLDLTVDFGGKFSCGIAAQTMHNPLLNKTQMNFLREFYVKDERKVRDLVNDFCNHYRNHRKKFVRVYGEPRGHDREPDAEPLYVRIARYFQVNGWHCEVLAHSQAMEHHIRHNLISEIFEEEDINLPIIRINANHCKNLILVLQITGILDDFKKDKSKERDPNYRQEHAPHFSDAFDNYITQSMPHLLNSDGTFWVPNEVGLI